MTIRRSHPLNGFFQLLLHSLAHRKLLAAAGVLGALCAVLLSVVRTGGMKSADSEPALAYEESVASYKRALESIDIGIRSYQTALAEEESYLSVSPVMQLKPYHVYTVTTVYEVNTTDGRHSIPELEALARAFARSVSDTSFLESLSERFDMEPRFLNELISRKLISASTTVTNAVRKKGTNLSALSLLSEDGTTSRFSITVKGDSFDFSDKVDEAIREYLLALPDSSDLAWYPCTLRVVSSTRAEAIDQTLRSGQKATSDRIYDYTDKLVKLGTARTGFTTRYKPAASAARRSAFSRISIRGLITGFCGGLIGAWLLTMLWYLCSGIIYSEGEFRRRFPVRLIAAPLPADEGNPAGQAEILDTLLRGRRSVILTGTCADEEVRQRAEEIIAGCQESGARLAYYPDFLANPDARRLLPDLDGTVLIERCGRSRCRDFDKELRILKDLGVDVIGTVLV